MKDRSCDKLIIAVVQGDDYQDVIGELNEHGFYATILHSKGGFLKKQSVTIMIGLHHDDLDQALLILKKHGERTETQYKPLLTTNSSIQPFAASIPVCVHCGGVVLFVLDVALNERY